VTEVTGHNGRYPARRALYPKQAVLHDGPPREVPTLVLTIALALRALAAARRVDPDVSTAAVRAAVEAALDAQLRERTPAGHPATAPDGRSGPLT
jgi:hypothetical protein